ncbi:hypothetical protein HDU67_007284 [Dinochytrium kinnereticum]|nr:hypothetical protein HDU67_007284 [Dinochytrium kinnereticum]
MSSVFGLAPSLLDQASAEIINTSNAPLTPPESFHQHSVTPNTPPPRKHIPTATSTTHSCANCGHIAFSTIEDQRSHFQSDWHRYNLRRLVAGKHALSEAEFDEQDEISSIDASDDDDGEEENDGEAGIAVGEDGSVGALFAGANGSPFQFFRLPDGEQDKGSFNGTTAEDGSTQDLLKPKLETARALKLYRHIFSKSAIETTDTTRMLEELKAMQCVIKKTAPSKQGSPGRAVDAAPVKKVEGIVKPVTAVWTMLMLGSGHFAAAVFEATFRSDCPEGTVLAHKTFHRYTTRRKQGGAQSSNDGSKGKANSGGAMIRRHNEQMLQQEIKDLLTAWKPYLDASTLIFTRVPARSRRSVFFDDSILAFKDNRVRSIPFTTRRPTLSELKRCFKELTTARVVEVDLPPPNEASQALPKTPERKDTPHKPPKSVTSPPDDATPPLDKTLLKLMDLVKRGKTDLITTLTTSPDFPTSLISAPFPDHHGTSLLHLAASHAQASTIALLLTLGADPTLCETTGKRRTPYEVADDKDSRDAFRRAFAADPLKWDWVHQANIPSMLTAEMEERQREKEREKKRKQKEKAKAMKESEAGKAALAAKEEAERVKREEEEMRLEKAKKGGVIGKLGKREKETIGVTPEMRARIDREKRALAAEGRIRAQQKKCSTCGTALRDGASFDKFQFRYCSTDCLKSEDTESLGKTVPVKATPTKDLLAPSQAPTPNCTCTSLRTELSNIKQMLSTLLRHHHRGRPRHRVTLKPNKKKKARPGSPWEDVERIENVFPGHMKLEGDWERGDGKVGLEEGMGDGRLDMGERSDEARDGGRSFYVKTGERIDETKEETRRHPTPILKAVEKTAETFHQSLAIFQTDVLARQDRLSARLTNAVTALTQLKADRSTRSSAHRPAGSKRAEMHSRVKGLTSKLSILTEVLDDLQSDLTRRMTPSKEHLNAVVQESSEVKTAVRMLMSEIDEKKPLWKLMWEEELHEIVTEQAFLKTLEEEVHHLYQGQENLTTTLINIIQGIQTLRPISPKHPMTSHALDVDNEDRQRDLTIEIHRRIYENPGCFDSESRMGALERAERLRRWWNGRRENEPIPRPDELKHPRECFDSESRMGTLERAVRRCRKCRRETELVVELRKFTGGRGIWLF